MRVSFVYDVGMKNRTIQFGMPVYVWRKKFRPMLLVIGLVIIYFVAMFLNDSEYFMDLLIHDPLISLLLIVFPAVVVMIALIAFAVRTNRYMKRFSMRSGRVCFVCDYDISNRLELCSECGAEWSLDGLGKGWRKLAEKELRA